MSKTILMLGLAALSGVSTGAVAAEADFCADGEPVPLTTFHPGPQQEKLQYAGGSGLAAAQAFVPPGRDAYPRCVDGKILPPAAYAGEVKLSQADQKRVESALLAARRYADVNAAFADGFRPEYKYGSGMGVHVHHLGRIFSDELDAGSPEFLTYVMSRTTGRWQLIQVGYVRRGLKRPKFFDSPSAVGHFHYENICVKDGDDMLKTLWSSEPCDKPGEVRVGPIWMMHLAVVVHNPEGLFADYFVYPDALSLTGGSYSFYGRELPPVVSTATEAGR